MPKEEIKKYEENPIPVQFLDKIFTSSSEQMIELPLRTIKLYTFKGDVVLDPFMGSGQTAIAALKASCHYTGHDILKEYVALAGKRIKRYLQEQITLFSEPTDAESQIISEKPRRKGYQVKIKYN
ncbi:MAG: DNA methyltransferase [Candidatus Omnitrophota bacterium]